VRRQLIATLSSLLLCASTVAAQETKRPNIVYMLSDNLGYGDLGAYGGGIIRGAPTPRLDDLAAQGIRFTNFNVEAECTPSRSALMTGRYAIRSGTTRAMPVPGIPQGLAPWEYTIAELLKDAGYNTAMLGKWHIGASPGRYPTDQGFDSWWGFPNSTDVVRFSQATGFDPALVPKFFLYEGTAAKGVAPVDEYTIARRPFIDETIERRAIDYINQQGTSDTPFFLFISWSLVHHPSLPHPDFAGKSGNGRYADVMMEHDYRVGRILDALDSAGLAEDTLVVYASDNGPDRAEYPFVGDTGPYRGFLGTVHEGSIRTPMMLRWPGTVASDQVSNEIVAIHDFFPTFATIAGGNVPDDRAIDGVDQSALILGTDETSARDSVLFFHDDTLLAVKWKQFKVYLQGEQVAINDAGYRDLWAPEIYNIMQDPKEANNIVLDGNLWIMAPLLQVIMPFVYSVDKYGLIQPGADERSEAQVRIPFFKQSLMERSLQALKKQHIMKKLHDVSGGLIGDDS
jgi:arylsulfatase A-like enzyme